MFVQKGRRSVGATKKTPNWGGSKEATFGQLTGSGCSLPPPGIVTADKTGE